MIYKGMTIQGKPAANWPGIQQECAKYGQFSVEVRNANPKSRKQLGDYWGHITKQIIDELTEMGHGCELLYKNMDSTGVKITPDMLKLYFYAMFPVLKEDGSRKTMRDFTTTDMVQFSENIRNFCAGQWGIAIMPPDKDWRKNAKLQ